MLAPAASPALPPTLPAALQSALDRSLVRLYSSDLDLHALPQAIFGCVDELIAVEQVSYGEFHAPSRDFRCLFLHNPDEGHQRTMSLEAYNRHAASHPFWQNDPAFYGERALRESDFFTDAEFMELPIAREVFLPSGARRIMGIVIALHGYVVTIACHRVLGRPAFSDGERDLLQALRGHAQRLHRQALERMVASLTLRERLAYLCPDLTRRQRDVAVRLAQSMSNEAIAQELHVSLDTVKSHVRTLFEKLGVEDRLAAAMAIMQKPLFARLPPLWSLPGSHGGPAGAQVNAPPGEADAIAGALRA
ncbi:LuxR C-terminal-related transcriptional regulator [Ramlibacter sp. H39-3-26]|uniref:helix-turn-helix transcriptional regulator n=1 Tax=Curvibacter soli TaxID=3031331 RepID=UPI0023DA2591|nr:LuxR C-terminal-related transcriptional regulator [Ramlibacter sp. H39-3-26]MDF1483870.1 LuxR C-terminal-related transcriptional regulator [Ramlibacter sp. H39-3-26]